METKVTAVIADISTKLNIDLAGIEPNYYTDGATDATFLV